MTEFKPDWARVCEAPKEHGWFHVWLQLDANRHNYWCKYCGLHGKTEVCEDTRQLFLPGVLDAV